MQSTIGFVSGRLTLTDPTKHKNRCTKGVNEMAGLPTAGNPNIFQIWSDLGSEGSPNIKNFGDAKKFQLLVTPALFQMSDLEGEERDYPTSEILDTKKYQLLVTPASFKCCMVCGSPHIRNLLGSLAIENLWLLNFCVG